MDGLGWYQSMVIKLPSFCNTVFYLVSTFPSTCLIAKLKLNQYCKTFFFLPIFVLDLSKHIFYLNLHVLTLVCPYHVPECTELAQARAGLSQKARAGLARLGSETKSKSELGSARARISFEFPSQAWLKLETNGDLRAELGSSSGEVNILSLTQ